MGLKVDFCEITRHFQVQRRAKALLRRPRRWTSKLWHNSFCSLLLCFNTGRSTPVPTIWYKHLANYQLHLQTFDVETVRDYTDRKNKAKLPIIKKDIELSPSIAKTLQQHKTESAVQIVQISGCKNESWRLSQSCRGESIGGKRISISDTDRFNHGQMISKIT